MMGTLAGSLSSKITLGVYAMRDGGTAYVFRTNESRNEASGFALKFAHRANAFWGQHSWRLDSGASQVWNCDECDLVARIGNLIVDAKP